MITQYIDSCIVWGFILSWQDAPPQYRERSIWDHVACRILHDAHLSQLVSWEPVWIISKAYDSFLVSHIILFRSKNQSLISCCLEAVHSCHCVLSLGWLEGLLHKCTMTEDQGDLRAMGNSSMFFSRPSKKYCPTRLPLRHSREFQGDVFFFNYSALCKNQYPCTYKDPISMVCEWPPCVLPSRN